MKRLINWLIVAVIGFALMIFSFFYYQYQPSPNPWKNAFMYIGKADPNLQIEGLNYVKRPIRLMPVPQRAGDFTQMAKSFGPDIEKFYHVAFQKKVILYTDIVSDFQTDMLNWGRLPSSDANEAVAGFYAADQDKVIINGTQFKVVGQFKKDVGLFVDSFLVGENSATAKLFDPNDGEVQNAYIFQMPKEKLTDLQIYQHLKDAFPKSQFTMYSPLIWTEKIPFFIYVLGMAILFIGSSFVLFRIYCFSAEKNVNNWLRLPLLEIGKYKRLFLALHFIYFGVVFLFMLVVYYLPELQICFLAGIKSQVADGSGPLGIAGKAYMSKSILRAAITTFAINFSLGSIAYITIPSIIIPAVGVLAIIFRAVMWGLLLAPTFHTLSRAMLPHSLTILLEGEGYIVASFFALLILVYLFRKADGKSVLYRYGRALLMNVRGNLLVAIVLVVAAIYEAIEVIVLMIKA
jgi:hypothetical protein